MVEDHIVQELLIAGGVCLLVENAHEALGGHGSHAAQNGEEVPHARPPLSLKYWA